MKAEMRTAVTILLLSTLAMAQNNLPNAPSASKPIKHPRLESTIVWATFTVAEVGDLYTSTHNKGCIETNPTYGSRSTGKYIAVDAAEQGAVLLFYFLMRHDHSKFMRVIYILPLSLGAQHAYGALHNFHNGCY